MFGFGKKSNKPKKKVGLIEWFRYGPEGKRDYAEEAKEFRAQMARRVPRYSKKW